MQRFEYRVVPAPARGAKVRGVKAAEDRFAHALATVMNEMAAEGWEYQRAETLPCEESKGFFSTGRVTVYRNMLVFRRPLAAAAAEVVVEAGMDAPDRGAGDGAAVDGAAVDGAGDGVQPAAVRIPAFRATGRRLAAGTGEEARGPEAQPSAPQPATPQPAGPQPVLRAARAEMPAARRPLTADDTLPGPRQGAVFRWPLRADAEGTPPRPVKRGE